MEIKHTLANIRKNIAEGKYKTHPRTEGTSTEESVQDLAEVELKSEERKYIVKEMMGEQYDKYFWNEKHA